jgi:hypothetical protein
MKNGEHEVSASIVRRTPAHPLRDREVKLERYGRGSTEPTERRAAAAQD